METPKRWVVDRDFPAYAYVPGQFPHPTRDPKGHSYGRVEIVPSALTEANWRESADYLFGVDLFNHGYYWEAHEAWEGLWHVAGRKGRIADFLKALIKLAAAGVKAKEGSVNGVRRAAERTVELLREIEPKGNCTNSIFMGLSLCELQSAADLVGRSAERLVSGNKLNAVMRIEN